MNRILLKVKKIDSDIKYFYSLINEMINRMDYSNISNKSFITKHNRYTYYYVIDSHTRIIQRLKRKKKLLLAVRRIKSNPDRAYSYYT